MTEHNQKQKTKEKAFSDVGVVILQVVFNSTMMNQITWCLWIWFTTLLIQFLQMLLSWMLIRR